MRIKDIADALHLSVSTVSKALNGGFDVSPETKEQVLKYAKTGLKMEVHGMDVMEPLLLLYQPHGILLVIKTVAFILVWQVHTPSHLP